MIEPINSSWVTKARVAEHFGCNVRTVGNLMRRKILPFFKVRGLLRFDLQECEAAMRHYRSRPLWEKDGKLQFPIAPPSNGGPQPIPAPAETPAPPGREAPPRPLVAHGTFQNAEVIRQALKTLEVTSPSTDAMRLPDAGLWVLMVMAPIPKS